MKIPGQKIATYLNIVERMMLWTFGYLVTMCCDMLSVANRTSTRALTQPCCKNLAKPVQNHHKCCMKTLTIFTNFESTTPNMSQHVATRCYNMLCWNVAIVWQGVKLSLLARSLSQQLVLVLCFCRVNSFELLQIGFRPRASYLTWESFISVICVYITGLN